MPKNNNLEPVSLPMEQKWGKKPTTKFQNNLEAIKLTLVDAPNINDLMNYLPFFSNATWADRPMTGMTEVEKVNALYDVFHFKTLPTALETIGLTFAIEGISLQEVTHIIRYRKGSFSAECSGDKWWTDKDALIPNSIQNSNGPSVEEKEGYTYATGERIHPSDFHARYKKIVEDAKQLYCDMIDSREISIMDARYILPRCLETFYYMRVSLGDAIHFIRQRIDKQIQPETDNIIAYQMYEEILKAFPLAYGLVNIHAPSQFYINTARTGKATNLYFPDADSDKFEWNENDFIYQCYRNEMNGTDVNATNLFDEFLKEHEEKISRLEEAGKEVHRNMLKNAKLKDGHTF
jgi:thymidylate synthase (FAD)